MKEYTGEFKEKEKIDKKALLKELALDIARKYSLEAETTEKLIQTDSLKSLDALKNELHQNEKYAELLKEKRLEELFFTLKGALEVVENMSKLKMKVLKDELDLGIVNIEAFENKVEDYLPQKLLQKAKNPNLPHEHILGLALGSANTIYKTTEILYKIGIGILKTPYDLYLIATGKGKIKSWGKI